MRHSWPFRATGATGPFRRGGGGCSAIPLLHLKNPRTQRKSAATRVARHVQRDRGSPHTCATMKGGIRICLPVHCLSASQDRQPYCHIDVASLSLVKARPNSARQSLASAVGTCSRCNIVLSSQSPHRCPHPLLACPCLNLPKKILSRGKH